jgi:hypothetical protein
LQQAALISVEGVVPHLVAAAVVHLNCRAVGCIHDIVLNSVIASRPDNNALTAILYMSAAPVIPGFQADVIDEVILNHGISERGGAGTVIEMQPDRDIVNDIAAKYLPGPVAIAAVAGMGVAEVVDSVVEVIRVALSSRQPSAKKMMDCQILKGQVVGVISSLHVKSPYLNTGVIAVLRHICIDIILLTHIQLSHLIDKGIGIGNLQLPIRITDYHIAGTGAIDHSILGGYPDIGVQNRMFPGSPLDRDRSTSSPAQISNTESRIRAGMDQQGVARLKSSDTILRHAAVPAAPLPDMVDSALRSYLRTGLHFLTIRLICCSNTKG